MDKIYTMELHDTCTPEGSDTLILRVPGGWIYTQYQVHQETMSDGQWSENYLPTSVFVPFYKEG